MKPSEHSWRERKSARLKDIAKSVGVSEATVSVVVNGARSGTRVSEATRAAVLNAAERLGYRPNAQARSLASGRANRFGLYSGRSRVDSRNLFFAELLGGMIEECRGHGINTVVHSTGSAEHDLLDLVSNRSVDGLVVHPEVNDPIIKMVGDLRIPVVCVADRVDILPSVCVADMEGGRLQANHLASLGHRKVLIKQSIHPSQSLVDRVQGFSERAAALGVEVLVSPGEHVGRDVLDSSDLDLLARREGRATAIVAWCDGAAEAVCSCLERAGISIPSDVAVMGFDGIPTSFARRFELTTIEAPWHDVGRTAVMTLLALMRGEPVPASTILPVRLHQGETA